MIRAVDAFDWESLVREFVKRLGKADAELVEVRFQSEVYYKATNVPAFGRDACFLFPDPSTVVVVVNEEEVRRLLERGFGARPEFVLTKTGTGREWADHGRDRQPRSKVELSHGGGRTNGSAGCAHCGLLQNATRWVFGVDGADAPILHAIATCETDNKTKWSPKRSNRF